MHLSLIFTAFRENQKLCHKFEKGIGATFTKLA
jgi:hypothetical protein